MKHPFALFNLSDIRRLKEAEDPALSAVLQEAKKALDIQVMDESLADASSHGKHDPQHGNYYAASIPFGKYMPYLGFAYHFTGDRVYAEKAKALMLTYAGYNKWRGSGWFAKSELVTAHFCIGMAYGYDMFYDYLTQEEREMIVEHTIAKGIQPTFEDWLLPGERVHAMETMGHNWWIVCISCAALVATVMAGDSAECERYAQMAADTVWDWFEYAGNPLDVAPLNIDNGSDYEGVLYLNFALLEYARFRMAYMSAKGVPPREDRDVLCKCADYFCHTCYPSSAKDPVTIGFGDSYEYVFADSLQYLQDIDSPSLRWYLANCKDQEVNLCNILFPVDPSKPAYPPKERSVLYEKIGWSILRDGFEKDASLLAVKCGDTWGHAHSDPGSFIFMKDGKSLVYDSGTCDYGHPLYVPYYCSSQAHNVLLWNGQGQDVRDVLTHARQRGFLYNLVDEGGIRYLLADATGPMSRYFRKHLRHFLWLDTFLLIYDDVEAYDEGEAEFLIHLTEEGERSFHMLSPCRCEMRTGYKDHAPETEVAYPSYIQATDDTCRVKFVSVVATDPTLVFDFCETEDAIFVSAGDWEVMINKLSDGRIMHRNCIAHMHGYETDAIMLAVCKDRQFVVNGSFVRKDGVSLAESLVRFTGLIGAGN